MTRKATERKDTSKSNGEMPPSETGKRILTIDIGGSKVKMLVSGEIEPRKAPSGRNLTPLRLKALAGEMTSDWHFDVISIGFPGLVGPHGPISEPANLGPGWVGFDYRAAFGKPVKMMNDAVMQALGNYEGGRMLFLGFGTGLGSALICESVIVTLELSNLRWTADESVGDISSKKALKKVGRNAWRKNNCEVIAMLMRAFVVDYVVVGGGNGKYLRGCLPPLARMGHNQTAFRGGYRIWGMDIDHLPAQDTLLPDGGFNWRLV